MVGGQALDLAAEGGRADRCAQVRVDPRRKTGALLRAAVRAGALVGGARRRRCCARLTRYGEHLGLAFQIADDILDATRATAVTATAGTRPRRSARRRIRRVLGCDGARRHARASARRGASPPLRAARRARPSRCGARRRRRRVARGAVDARGRERAAPARQAAGRPRASPPSRERAQPPDHGGRGAGRRPAASTKPGTVVRGRRRRSRLRGERHRRTSAAAA